MSQGVAVCNCLPKTAWPPTYKTANIHVQVGKTSFETQKLVENFAALMEAIKKARPSGAKGFYIRRITMASTMGPGVKVEPNAAQSMQATE